MIQAPEHKITKKALIDFLVLGHFLQVSSKAVEFTKKIDEYAYSKIFLNVLIKTTLNALFH